jgi:hypothetical protein
MMTRLINHFEKDGYQHARFNWDGTGGSEQYTLGECGANAVGCFALMDDPANDEKVKTNLKKAWNGQLMTGQYRYYDGLVHYLSMLHLCGSFKIYKPMPEIKEKTVEGPVYNGVTYTESTTIDAFEDCELYKVTINVNKESTDNESIAADNNSVEIAPNPAKDFFTVKSAKEVESIEIMNIAGQTLSVNDGDSTVEISLAAGTYIVKIVTEDGEVHVKRLNVRQ